jgi:hypothetical protein
MIHSRFKTTSLFLLLLFQVTTTLFSQCIKGDCSNGVGYYIYTNKDFYIGFFSNGLREGVGFYYQAETENTREVYEAAFWQQGTAINSQALIISSGGTSVGNTDANGKITKGVYIDNSLQVFIVYASGKLPADAADCLYGDCQDGYGIFKFADSKGLDHYYVGNFKNAKFNGKGIEVVLENSSVLIGEFENDGNKEGINYLFDDQTANYYVGSSLKEEFKFDYPEYIRPIVSPITPSSPIQTSSVKNTNPEKKKRGWGSFLNAAGGALLLVGAAVLVNELSDNGGSNKSTTPKATTTSKPISTNTNSNLNKTPNNAAALNTPAPTADPKRCRYHLEWRAFNDVLTISNIYSEPVTLLVSDNLQTPTPANGFTVVSHFRSEERIVVMEKRADLIRQYEDDGFEIKYITKPSTCKYK